MDLINGNETDTSPGINNSDVACGGFHFSAATHHNIEAKRTENLLLDQKLIIS